MKIKEEWISVQERLPRLDMSHPGWEPFYSDDVLIAVKEKSGLHKIRMAYITHFSDETPKWVLTGRDGYGVDGEVTHWRILPDPPGVML